MKKFLIYIGLIIIGVVIIYAMNKSNHTSSTMKDSTTQEKYLVYDEHIGNYLSKFVTNDNIEMMEYTELPSLEDTLINIRMINKFGTYDPKKLDQHTLKKMIIDEMDSLEENEMGLYKKYDLLYSVDNFCKEVALDAMDFIRYDQVIQKDIERVAGFLENDQKNLVMYLQILSKIVLLNKEKEELHVIVDMVETISHMPYDHYTNQEQMMIGLSLIDIKRMLGIRDIELEESYQQQFIDKVNDYDIDGHINIGDMVILNKGLHLFSDFVIEDEKISSIMDELSLMLTSKNDFMAFVKIQFYEMAHVINYMNRGIYEWVRDIPCNEGYIYFKPVDMIPTFRSLYVFLRSIELNDMKLMDFTHHANHYLNNILNVYNQSMLSNGDIYYAYMLTNYIDNEKLNELVERSIKNTIDNVGDMTITKNNVYDHFMLYKALEMKEHKSRKKVFDKLIHFFEHVLHDGHDHETLFMQTMRLNTHACAHKKVIQEDIPSYEEQVLNYKGDSEIFLLHIYTEIYHHSQTKISDTSKEKILHKLKTFKVAGGYSRTKEAKHVNLFATQLGQEIQYMIRSN
ncbi:hypothetical protein HZI73_11610 [Vallitalea pronyensis]|uniref:Uncharacterized protein n=1 Tax=Vallitalea pronyensis TaxID=1348613 RepID=A0A8J8MKB7_9FIRM|nr:hypothetical protein [Vallitalea pronyensis]QUI22893.1 hypothetical protein HZI73_11610 [Vallitalea pronyensis]